MEKTKNLKSGEFLVKEVSVHDIFVPEEYNEEQLMIAQTCKDFIEAEVYPHLDELDQGNRELMKEILKKSGELGLMGISIPEDFGGFGQSFVTQMLAAETIGAGYSFSVAFMAHCGIGTLPIMYYGNEEQRQRYIPQLATGDLLGAYCLTEPGAGSDANSGKTTAIPTEDGKHYILNGQKMWITNAGFCDTQIVFAKVENDRILSAFIVESDMPGVRIGPDEHKMGIKGSSTAQVYYTDVKVPAENMLGARGEGFRIALSILHMGRMKLGANVIGAAKKAITDSVKYANERKQFCVLISSFGAIQHKLAEMVIRTYAHESAIYRVSKDIDDLMDDLKAQMPDAGRATIEAISHYAVEDAILKVYGSEMLDYVVDEAVQIHGGMGYSAEMNVERGYRDSRINRIFEGTNEINRLLVGDTAIKRALKGDFDLFGPAEAFYNHLDRIDDGVIPGEDYFKEKQRYVKNFKKVALLCIYAANKQFSKKLVREQEVMMNIADMISELYIAESLALRVEKIQSLKGEGAGLYKEILDVFVYDAANKIRTYALDCVYSLPEKEKEDKLVKAVEVLTRVKGTNVKEVRRKVAAKLIEDNEYRF
ncbi:MAG: acyl-CoA dehydrogenase family protein [Bacteroides sp.]|jgi:alkylation response protein AidB-like acyl-CoA dehydrogenase|nr:acyl-CoA dehydrogenase family protein [Bacteroides sp.]